MNNNKALQIILNIDVISWNKYIQERK